MRNAIRPSALMGTRVLNVMTHDSIGLGENGPTHQPVEHLASLRAMPSLTVFRPADTVETLEAYELAVQLDGPSVLVFSRQATPSFRRKSSGFNLTSLGGYVLREAEQGRDITLIATGTEVALALVTADLLAEQDIKAAVVSLPSWELFDKQDPVYREQVLGSAPRLAIEAASSFEWTRYVDRESDVVSVNEYGESASAEDLYRKFGLVPSQIVDVATNLIARS